jgi:putative NADH-flavin reductase
MNVLIFGASGATGKHLVRQALDQQHQVTAFVRDPAKLDIRHEHLKLEVGDVINYNAVENAIRGKDAVISALGAKSPFKFDQIVVDGMRNIIKAMKKTNVERLIYLSFIGATESRKNAGFVIRYVAPRLLKTEIKGHALREQMIKESSLKWTIVHAPTLTNGPKKGQYQSDENLKTTSFVVSISRADVADFMLRQLNDKSYLNKTVRLMPSNKL